LLSIGRLDEAVDGDLDRLIIIHDMKRWAHLDVVAEVEGFRICRC
jgi:hypothetical protein